MNQRLNILFYKIPNICTLTIATPMVLADDATMPIVLICTSQPGSPGPSSRRKQTQLNQV